MLAIPASGFGRSVQKHNVDDDLFCDWIEASAVFGVNAVTKSDVLDILLETAIYESQDFAIRKIDDIWPLVKRRVEKLNNPLGIKVTSERIAKSESWKNCPSYSFCLLLSCAALYPKWWGEEVDGYTEQGDLFEQMAEESMWELLPNWQVRRVGWPAGTDPKTTVNNIVQWIGEKQGSDFDLHITTHVKDFGLDLLMFLPFEDEFPGVPVMMTQCASGKHWRAKRKQPDMDVWNSVINFNTRPVKVFITPYSFAHKDDFRRETASIGGVCIDRYRLLSPLRNDKLWPSKKLKKSIVTWSKDKVTSLPQDTDQS